MSDKLLTALRSSGEAGDLLCLHAAEEIERLQLTAAESAALERIAGTLEPDDAAVLRYIKHRRQP